MRLRAYREGGAWQEEHCQDGYCLHGQTIFFHFFRQLLTSDCHCLRGPRVCLRRLEDLLHRSTICYHCAVISKLDTIEQLLVC
jgi:hypothetical protein